MKASNELWRERLLGEMPEPLSGEIDVFETEIQLRKQGRLEEKLFAETRLRRGAYGQRYDNGHRYDGIKIQELKFPAGSLTKGPDTFFDAPGMQRIKIPFGGMNARQLEVMAELAEEYSDGIAHVTTRQDFQLHYIHIDDTPALMRRLAAVGITTKEACGNSVRNVTACPVAGVCHDEAFDVTGYAGALAWFLMGHPDTQDFGRKVKIAFSGCPDKGCGLVNIHDLGFIAAKRVENGKEIKGFKVFVGGGLGSVPHHAKVLEEFVPEEELFPVSQAVCRVFARLGEKKNRARARIKFVVAKLGIEEFSRLVREERKILPPDDRWKSYLSKIKDAEEQPLKPAGLTPAQGPGGFDSWVKENVYVQKQKGYSTVTVKLPLGDITAAQLRQLADISRKYVRDTIRTTVEQNIVLRWVSSNDLAELYKDLASAGLGEAGAESIKDIVSCPGTDTCKLGIASSRGLAGELYSRFKDQNETDEDVRKLRIKVSGCFNSCGQHHIADLGFYGISRKVGNYTIPHFQVVLGGKWQDNGGSYGLPIAAIPSKRIPEVVKRMTDRYRKDKTPGEAFVNFIQRIGKAEVKNMIEDLSAIPAYANEPGIYSDWGDPREFSLGDMGVGECAGEVVSQVEFDLAASERLIFEAQIELDEKKNFQKAGEMATKAMQNAAWGLVRFYFRDCPNHAETIVKEFRSQFVDTQVFWDQYAGGKFAQYFFIAQEASGEAYSQESAHQRVEEAQLFVEASYTCYAKISSAPAAVLK